MENVGAYMAIYIKTGYKFLRLIQPKKQNKEHFDITWRGQYSCVPTVFYFSRNTISIFGHKEVSKMV